MIDNYHDSLLAGIGSGIYPVYVNFSVAIKRAKRKHKIKKARSINKCRKVGDPFYVPKL